MTESRAIMATCGSIDSWMRNAQGEDPCQIASRLLGKCTSDGVFNLPSILPGSIYPPPSTTQATPCQCNTVAYSLMSACALCQNGMYQNFTTWVSNCLQSVVQYERYPNQSSADVVPPFAFLPLDSGDFNLAGAIALNQAVSASTSSSVSSAAPTTTVISSTTSTSTTPATSISRSNNLLIAITVGVSLTLLCCLVGGFIFYRHRQRWSHRYNPFFSRRNRPTSIASIDSDTKDEAKFLDPPASIWDKVFSSCRVWPNTPGSPYAQVQLSDNRLPPSKQLSHPQTQMSINPSTFQSTPSRSNQPRSMLARVLSNFRLSDNLTQFDTPYARVQLSDEVEYAPTQSHPLHTPPSSRRPLHPQTAMSMTQDVPSSSNPTPSIPSRSQLNLGPGEHRPRPNRFMTLPVIQTISRTDVSRSSTMAQPSTTPRDDMALPRIPLGVKSVPRAPGFTIEDTPTTTDGYPIWKRKRPPIRRDFFNPEIGASVSSLGTFSSISTQRVEGEDSDSVLLITRPSDVLSLSPKASETRSIRSYSTATSVDDSSKSTAGSSMPPFSPAISSVFHDAIRYGNAESREQLFPASVRANGYTGVPP